MYERAALLLDSAEHALGDLPLALITLGLRPLYTTDLDEAVLLAREYRSQVGAVLLPATLLEEQLAALRKRVLEPLRLPLSAVVPVGDRLPPERCETLRDEGMRFQLRTPYEAHELRFVVSCVLSETDPEELRLERRVPCDLPVEVESEHRTVNARLADLSAGGAFVALSHPQGERTMVTLRFSLLDEARVVTARVAWRTSADAPPWRDRGMGVEFVRLDAATRVALRRTVATQVHRFRL